MKEQEIKDFVDALENLYLENQVAKNYLKAECAVQNPSDLLQKQIKLIPPDAQVRLEFAAVKQVIGQSLLNSEAWKSFLERLLKLLGS